MTERLGDAPIQPQFRELMNKIGRILDQAFNGDAKGEDRKNGFVLIVFPFVEAEFARAGQEGRANYISNAAREDVVVMLKEQIKRFEGQPEMKGHA